VFVTRFGRPWVKVEPPKPGSTSPRTAVVKDAVGLEFGKLMRATKTHVVGRSFYALRHTFRTVADEVGDRPAVDLIMGHENGADIATHYVERIGDARLKRVSDKVRGWASIRLTDRERVKEPNDRTAVS
jgi:integrase